MDAYFITPCYCAMRSVLYNQLFLGLAANTVHIRQQTDLWGCHHVRQQKSLYIVLVLIAELFITFLVGSKCQTIL